MAKKKSSKGSKGTKGEIGEEKSKPSAANNSSTTLGSKLNAVVTAVLIAILAIYAGFYFAGENNDVSTGPRFVTPELEALVQWIEENGGFIDSRIAIRDGPLGRGVFLDGGDVNDDDGELYSIPETLYISWKTMQSKNSVMGPLLDDPQLDNFFEHETIMVAIALLAERNTPNSFWQPYIQSLPQSHDDQALFWSDAELNDLQSPIVVKQIHTSRRWLNSHYDTLLSLVGRYPELFPDESTIMDDFLWAYYIVTSRCFDVARPQDKDDEHSVGLNPFVDLLNHAFGKANHLHKIALRENDVSYWIGVPKKNLNVSKGDELVWSYKNFAEASMNAFYRHGMLDGDTDANTHGDYIVLKAGGKDWPVSAQGQVDSILFQTVPVAEIRAKVKGAIDELITTLEEDKAMLNDRNRTKEVRWVALVLRVRYKQILHKLLAWLEDGAEEGGLVIRQGERTTAQSMFVLEI